MDDLARLQKLLTDFREARDWAQFHTPKDLAMSVVLESAELMEHFQWKSHEEVSEYLKDHTEHVAEEMADILNWLVLLAHDLDIDLIAAAERKIEKNGRKYPVEKAKGNHKKYTELASN